MRAGSTARLDRAQTAAAAACGGRGEIGSEGDRIGRSLQVELDGGGVRGARQDWIGGGDERAQTAGGVRGARACGSLDQWRIEIAGEIQTDQSGPLEA